MAPPNPQTATVTGGDQNIVVQNTGSHVVIQVGTEKLESLSHARYLSPYQQSAGERRLLIAQAQGIPFYLAPRENDLLHLRDWLDQPNTISIRTLLGRAGTGKTRTAVEFVNREQSRADWNFGWLTARELKHFVEHASLAGKIWNGNTCLILDYASASVDALKKLLQEGLVYAGEGPGKLRLLLLDRSDAGWYEALLPLGHQKAAVQALFAESDPRRLSSFINVEHRRELLASAVSHFCALKSLERLTLPKPGQDLIFDQRLAKSEPWGDPLFLILAAAASAQLGLDRSLSMSRTELARFAAEHEADRLRHILAGAPLHHMVALVTLAGGACSTQAREAIKSERERLGWSIAAADLLDRLKTALPGPDSSRLGKVEPDIIGEAFILGFLKTIPGEETAFLQAARGINAAGTGQTLVHTLQNFALGAGAQVTATESTEQAERARRAGEESLLIRLLSEYVERCSASENDTLWAILDAIPFTSTSMAELALSICDQLESSVSNADGMSRLRLMNQQGIRLSAMGRNTEALAISRREVLLLRELAASQPDTFRQGLAMSLNNQASLLSNIDHSADALDTITEAVELFRELASADPHVFRPDLAMSLCNRANRLTDLGRHTDALSAIDQGLDHYRELATSRPDAFRPELAGALKARASMLSNLNQHADGLDTINRSLELFRELADAQPDAFRPALASTLQHQADRLSGLGQPANALSAANQAVDLYRELATAQPHRFCRDLALTLSSQARILKDLGLPADALSVINQSLVICRELAAENPTTSRQDLALFLNNQANLLSDLSRFADAISAINEAVELFCELADAQPDAFLPGLAMALHNQAKILGELDQPVEALVAIKGAIAIRRGLVSVQPEAFRPDLAMSLNNQAKWFGDLGQPSDALVAITEAVAIRSELADAQPEAFLPALANSLSNQTNVLIALGQRAEALSAIAQAVEIRRKLSDARPDRFAPELATSCCTLGQILGVERRPNEAADVFVQGLVALLPLLETQPEAVDRLFAQLLKEWGDAGRELGLPRSDQFEELLQQFFASHTEPTPGESDDQS